MKLFIILLPLIIIIVLRAIIVIGNRESDNNTDEFWAREREALFARNKDISGIELFSPDISMLPFHSETDMASDSELINIEKKVIAASKEPMLDLHEMTNTDIKIEYGPANFPTISKYDQNYMYFVRDIHRWGKYLYDNKLYDDARIVLEYNLTLSKDMSGVYTMLGLIYRESGEIKSITNLIHIAEESDALTSNSICAKLKDIINSY